MEIYNSLQTYSLLSRADGRERPLPSFHPRRTILIPRHSSSLKRILIAIATELEGSRVTGKDRLATSVSQTSTSQTLSGKLLQRGILHFQGVSFKAITLWASVKHLGTALSTIEAIFASAIVFCQRFIERQREDLYFCIEIFSGRGYVYSLWLLLYPLFYLHHIASSRLWTCGKQGSILALLHTSALVLISHLTNHFSLQAYFTATENKLQTSLLLCRPFVHSHLQT